MRGTIARACAGCASVVQAPEPLVLLVDLADGGLKWSVTIWAETARLPKARDEAIAAVRDALRSERIGPPVPVTTVRMLDRTV